MVIPSAAGPSSRGPILPASGARPSILSSVFFLRSHGRPLARQEQIDHVQTADVARSDTLDPNFSRTARVMEWMQPSPNRRAQKVAAFSHAAAHPTTVH